MKTNRYRYRVCRTPRSSPFRALNLPALTREAILQGLPDAVIGELAPATAPFAGMVLELALDRRGHFAAIRDTSSALQQIGWQVVDAFVQELVSNEVELMFAGGGGGGLIVATTRDPWGMLGSILVGGVLGYVSGLNYKTPTVTYHWREADGFWYLDPVQHGIYGSWAFSIA